MHLFVHLGGKSVFFLFLANSELKKERNIEKNEKEH